MSPGNSHPLSDISSGLFCGCKCHLRSYKTKRSCAGEKDTKESTKEKSHSSPLVKAPRTPKDTGGEVDGLSEKLIQLERSSQQRHVGFQRSTPRSQKSPFRSLAVTPYPFRERNPAAVRSASGYSVQRSALCLRRVA